MASAPRAAEAERPVSQNRLTYEQQKERNRRLKKLEKAVEACESRIDELEAAVRILEERLSTPDGASDTGLYERHGMLKKQLDEAVEEWEARSEELEATRQNEIS